MIEVPREFIIPKPEAPQGKGKGHMMDHKLDCPLCHNRGWVTRFMGDFWDEDECYMAREACDCQVVEMDLTPLLNDEYEKDCPTCGQLAEPSPTGWCCVSPRHHTLSGRPAAVWACLVDGLGWCQACYDKLEG